MSQHPIAGPSAGTSGRFPTADPDDQAHHVDPVFDVLFGAYLQHLLRDGRVQVAFPPPRQTGYRSETPIEGEGAVERLIALHDRARTLRAALRPEDGVGARQVQRAIRSLFLYEHQLTPRTRRQARTVLWCRDRAEELPPFVERVRWARCRCPDCQTPQYVQPATRAARQGPDLVRSAYEPLRSGGHTIPVES
jgi:hypothetical protein